MKIELYDPKIKASRFSGRVEIAWEEIAPFWERVVAQIVTGAELPGFRKGKAPKALVLKNFDQEELQRKVLSAAMSAILQAISLKETIAPISTPWVKIITLREGTLVKLEISFDIWPQIELKNYRHLKIKARGTKLSEEEFAKALLSLQRSRAEYVNVDRPAKLGDFVEVEFEGRVNGLVREELSSKRFPLFLGDGRLLPQLELALLGLKKGEKKSLSLSSKLLGSRYGGEKVDFTLHLLEVYEVKLPPLNDDFAMAFSKKNLALLKSALAEELAEKQKEEAELEADQRFAEEILNFAQFEVPQVLIEQVLVEKMNRFKEEAKRAGLGFADYLAMLKTTEKELWDSLKEIAAKEAKIAVILSEIVKKEGLKFEQEVNLIREVRKHLNNQ